MSGDPGADPSEAIVRSAQHLADLDARHDAHLAAIRARAARLREAGEAAADELAETVGAAYPEHAFPPSTDPEP